MATMDREQAVAMGRRARETGFSRNKALRHAPTDSDLRQTFMDAYDEAEDPALEDDEKEAATDETIQEALMELLEVKLAAFMGRADLSDSPPADKIAIRAAYFLGVNAGLSLGKAMDDVAEDRTVVVPILPNSTDEDKQ